MEVTKKEFGVESRGFYITAVKGFAKNPGRAIRWALNHMFKYVAKPPAVTPERLAALIAAFDTTKRVRSLGLFFGKKPKTPDLFSKGRSQEKAQLHSEKSLTVPTSAITASYVLLTVGHASATASLSSRAHRFDAA
jgi:hypothetical protein